MPTTTSTAKAERAIKALVEVRQKVITLDDELDKARTRQKDLYVEAFLAGATPAEMARAMQPDDWHYLAETIRQDLKARGFSPKRRGRKAS
jgi:hypothetical protein